MSIYAEISPNFQDGKREIQLAACGKAEKVGRCLLVGVVTLVEIQAHTERNQAFQVGSRGKVSGRREKSLAVKE